MKHPILVVSKRAGGTKAPAGYTVIPVDRCSPLGNPFVMGDESRRDKVCDQYRDWLADATTTPRLHTAAITAIYSITRQYVNGEKIALECWCAPKRCHAESIRDTILRLAGQLEGEIPAN